MSIMTSNPLLYARSSRLVVTASSCPICEGVELWLLGRKDATNVELEEARSVAVGLCDVLGSLGSRGREAVGQPELASDSGGDELALWVIIDIQADGSKEDRRGYLVAQQVETEVADAGVDEHAGNDAPSVESLAVGPVGPAEAGV